MFWLILKKINPMDHFRQSIGCHMLNIYNVFLNDVCQNNNNDYTIVYFVNDNVDIYVPSLPNSQQ